MLKNFITITCILLLSTQITSGEKIKKIKQRKAIYNYYGNFQLGYLEPLGDVKKLNTSASQYLLGFHYKIDYNLHLGGEFAISSLGAEFKHDNFGYEQDRRFYQLGFVISYPIYIQKKLDYRRYYSFKPRSGLFLRLKYAYTYHALVFKMIQQRRSFWDEDDINFARSGFGPVLGLSYFRIFDIGFGLPIGIDIRFDYHLIDTEAKKKYFYLYDKETDNFVKHEPLFPGSLKEKYWSLSVGVMVFNINLLDSAADK